MYRASTLDGNILDIPDRKAVLNCTYDIKISTSQADVKTKIEADSELFPIEFMTKLYESFKADEKPEWLTMEQIRRYAAEMLGTGS
jgi:hypothetical protein